MKIKITLKSPYCLKRKIVIKRILLELKIIIVDYDIAKDEHSEKLLNLQKAFNLTFFHINFNYI